MTSITELELQVLVASQPIGDYFLSAIPAKLLVEIAYADVRRLAEDPRDVERYLGIQRRLSSTRVKQIKKYIRSSDATFPTSVILAVEEECAEFDETRNVLVLRPYEPEEGSEERAIPYEKIAKILDGQHRLAAFLDDNNVWDATFDDIDFDLNVAIFVGADLSEQASIFATVNLAQTRVSKNLVYDLTELSNTPSPHKTCHNVAVALDSEESSPLFERIKRLGTATPGRRKEPLTQAAFVESLVRFLSQDPLQDRNDLLDGKKLKRATPEELKKTPFRNMFIAGKELDIAELLYNYFKAVEKKWPKSWNAVEATGNLLPKSNAFKALMRFLKDDVYLEIAEDDIGYVPSVEEFYPYFKPIKVRDQDFTTSNFAPGSGGQARFLKMLRREISLEDMIE